jgi:hypothetical protein
MAVRVSRCSPAALVLALPLVGCTWLVAFDTLPCDAGSCADAAFGGQDSGLFATDAPVLVTDTGSIPDSTQKDSAPTPDTTAVPPDSTVSPDVSAVDSTTAADTAIPMDTFTPAADTYVNPCASQTEGHQWGTDPTDICCSDQPIQAISNTNCGVCGLTCNTGAGQSCGSIDGHYLCLGCVANSDCWSQCCAIDTTPYHCAATVCATGVCSTTDDPCAQYGATCVANGVGYCSY